MPVLLQGIGPAAACCSIQTLPLYLTPIHAGFPSPAEDFVEMALDLNQHLVSNPVATYFLKVTGDSMNQVGIYDGDLIVVDTSVSPRHQDIVVAALNGEFTLKRYLVQGDTICLKPENPEYPVIKIQKGDELILWGVVRHAVHSF